MTKTLLMSLCLAVLPLSAGAQLLNPPSTPQEGVDYQTLPTVQPLYKQKPGIEVAEVFSYGCIHCAKFQPMVNAWRKTTRPDVRLEYVPAAFGGPGDNFARAFFAAEAMGMLKQTHDAAFKGVFEEKKIQRAEIEEFADMYAGFGVDRARFLAAMNSPATSAKLARAREYALRANIEGTPTLVINGKYKVMGRRDQGMESMLRTADFLIARERAARKAKPPSARPASGASAKP